MARFKLGQLIPARDMAAALHEIADLGLAVLGIEGFVLDGTSVCPQLDMIADYSPRAPMDWESHRERCAAAALRFAQAYEQREDVHFEILTWSAEEFANAMKQHKS